MKKLLEKESSLSGKQLKVRIPELEGVAIRTIQYHCNKTLELPTRRMVKKPLLNCRMMDQRLDFARQYQRWTVDDWKKVMFSDESRFELRFGQQSLFCRQSRESDRPDLDLTSCNKLDLDQNSCNKPDPELGLDPTSCYKPDPDQPLVKNRIWRKKITSLGTLLCTEHLLHRHLGYWHGEEKQRNFKTSGYSFLIILILSTLFLYQGFQFLSLAKG